MKVITTIRLDREEGDIIDEALSLLGQTLETMKNSGLEYIEPDNVYTVSRNDIVKAFDVLDNFFALCSGDE